MKTSRIPHRDHQLIDHFQLMMEDLINKHSFFPTLPQTSFHSPKLSKSITVLSKSRGIGGVFAMPLSKSVSVVVGDVYKKKSKCHCIRNEITANLTEVAVENVEAFSKPSRKGSKSNSIVAIDSLSFQLINK